MSIISTVISILGYSIFFLVITLKVVPQLYRLQNRHSTYHILKEDDPAMWEDVEKHEDIFTKIYNFLIYYSVIVLFTLGASAFLNSFGVSFALGAVLSASWEQPVSILLMEGFLLLMFSTIRVTSLVEIEGLQRYEQSGALSDQLNGYLFSFILTSYFLFMYQLGRVILSGDVYNIVVSISYITEVFTIFLFSIFMTVPIVVFTEYLLKIVGVADHMKIVDA